MAHAYAHRNGWSLTALAVIIIALSAGVAFAWTGPTQTAPNGDVPTLINVGATSQVKAGGIWATSVGSNNGYCIGTFCLTAWPSTTTSPWTKSGTVTYYSTGNVGIGTASPVASLDVNGYVRLAPQSSAPATCDVAHKGSIAVSNTASHVCVCNGSSWIYSYNGAACVW